MPQTCDSIGLYISAWFQSDEAKSIITDEAPGDLSPPLEIVLAYRRA